MSLCGFATLDKMLETCSIYFLIQYHATIAQQNKASALAADPLFNVVFVLKVMCVILLLPQTTVRTKRVGEENGNRPSRHQTLSPPTYLLPKSRLTANQLATKWFGGEMTVNQENGHLFDDSLHFCHFHRKNMYFSNVPQQLWPRLQLCKPNQHS